MWLLRPGEWESTLLVSQAEAYLMLTRLVCLCMMFGMIIKVCFILLQFIHLCLPLFFCEINKSLKHLIYTHLAYAVCLPITMLRDLPYLIDLSNPSIENINKLLPPTAVRLHTT